MVAPVQKTLTAEPILYISHTWTSTEIFTLIEILYTGDNTKKQAPYTVWLTTHIFHDKGAESVMWEPEPLNLSTSSLSSPESVDLCPDGRQLTHFQQALVTEENKELCRFMTSRVVSFSSFASEGERERESEKKKFEEKSLVSGLSPFTLFLNLSRRSLSLCASLEAS